MLPNKRIIIVCGHYGSGKTNVVVNLAFRLKERYQKVALADMDIVNPYFRAKDSAAALQTAGIRVICSPYASSNLDAPALPAELYAVTDDPSYRYVLDVGGDDRGALALGRLVPAIKKENDYAMLAVVNRYRPLTRTAADTAAVLSEIEKAAGLSFTAVVNASNLGAETTAQTVLDSVSYADEIAQRFGVPIAFTAVKAEVAASLTERIPDLFPIAIQ